MGIGVEIVVEEEGDVFVVSIEGRMDASTSPVIEKKLAGLLDKAKKIIIDFSDIIYLSSAGMRLLLSMTKKMQAKGGAVAFYGMSEDVFEIIKIAGFEKVLKIASTKKEALKLV